MVQIVWVKPLEANDSTQKWNSSTSKPLPFSFKSKETWPEIVLERVNTTTKTKQKRIKNFESEKKSEHTSVRGWGPSVQEL